MRFSLSLITAALLVSAGVQAEPIAYDGSNRLLPPTDYREWVFLTSSIDMSYNPPMPGMKHASSFGNLFVNPEAYRGFMATGTWPDKTILVSEHRSASGEGSITKAGQFQTTFQIMEIHVKDGGKWAFYQSNGKDPAPKIPESADCYSCHAQHGAVDTTFVQFYPTLIDIAKAKGTSKTAEGVKSGDATPASVPAKPRTRAETNAIVEKILAGIEQGNPDYDAMTPEAAQVTQVNMKQYLGEAMSKMGARKSLMYMTSISPPVPLVVDGRPQQIDQYQATYDHGWIQWRLFVAADGKIARLIPFSVNAPGVN